MIVKNNAEYCSEIVSEYTTVIISEVFVSITIIHINILINILLYQGFKYFGNIIRNIFVILYGRVFGNIARIYSRINDLSVY